MSTGCTVSESPRSLYNMLHLVVTVLLVATPLSVLGHGRLIDPPNRSSCFRFGHKGCVTNWDDDALYCGGMTHQWENNGGKCGVCGDAWDLPQPRDNEAGGKYGKGVIVKTYQSGQLIDLTVELTAPHLGWFEFRLCKNDDVNKIITHECLNLNLLKLEDGTTRYTGPINRKGNYFIKAYLPAGLTCSQCVLQWKYHSGNNWGCDETGCGDGKGPQEEFYGCSDITIV